MRRFSTIVMLLTVVLAGPATPAERPQPAPPDNIKSIITHNCSVSGCHQGRYPTGNLNLEPNKLLSSVLDVASLEVPGKKIVDTAAPEKSYLLSKIKGEPGIVGARMPAGRDPLSADQIKAVETWILSLKDRSSGTRGSGGNGGGGNGHDPEIATERPASSPMPAFNKPAFWGTRIVNLPTGETIDKGKFLFRISHRFVPAVASGWDGFYGLDGPAFVMPSFGYGITDKLMVSVGRSNFNKEWEFSGAYRLFEPARDSAFPLAGALHVGAGVVGQDKPADAEWSGRFRFSALVSLSWQVTDRISLLAVPGFASNTNYRQPDPESTFSFGLGGRALVFDDVSVIAEWIPVLAGYKDYINGWGLGVEKKIGGHVFQVFITNCYGLTAAQYLVGGDLGQFKKGFFDKFRLGFNIFRIL